jgi:hypothetical protein
LLPSCISRAKTDGPIFLRPVQMMERAHKASLANAPIPPPLAPGGNQWLKTLLRMPEEMVTGTIESEAALADGTFSDKVLTISRERLP